MSDELPRLKDLGGADGDLLRAATADAPSRRGRNAAAIALGLGPIVAPPVPPPPAAATTAGGAAKVGAAAKAGVAAKLGIGAGAKIAIAIAALTGAAVTAKVVASNAPAKIIDETHVAVVAPPVAATPPPPPIVAPPPPPVLLEPPAPPAKPHVAPRTPPASVGSAGDLASEVGLVNLALSSLHAGDIAGALQALDTYDRKFPHGTMGPEATVARIEALARSGDRTRAAALAHDFLAAHPDSPLAHRVRGLVP